MDEYDKEGHEYLQKALIATRSGDQDLNRAILLIVAWFWLGKTRISLVLV